ncbi:class I adenylate-forming enzyme family protein [Desulfobulbus oligotrophicus]|uniref:Acyl--CoA ligase n=1 Tax=Desulfobulbus oligotrophicus TaxID=1909699 RepID=A0A7T5VBB8_9BACT|nr:class I adenylate-forming enzyme family protein [Desulfobulbus oligotrophicus]QQG64720.1 acyl--CoA ligase [Desulfobulbus oligotrophicus]
MLLTDYLTTATERNPAKTLLIHGDRRFTYGDVNRAAQGIATGLLGFGLEPGFRGALLTDDPFCYIASYFGIQLAGGVVVGLNTQTSAAGLAYVLDDCRASVLIAANKFVRYIQAALPQAPSVQQLVLADAGEDPQDEQPWRTHSFADLCTCPPSAAQMLPYRSACDFAQIIYTSGTTGKPKGVVLRHANLIANTTSIVSYLGLQSSDRVMAVLPFFYSYGNSILLTHVAVGGSLVVNQSFLYPNTILQQMLDHEVTGFSGVPSTYALLLNRSSIASFSFPKLRYLTQAGAAMSPELARRLKGIFPASAIYIMYGQTEACARLAYLPPEELERKPGSIGKGIPGVELQVLDKDGKLVLPGEIGEIVARGENIMAGYWNRVEETREVLRPEGLWTGDLAQYDEEGFLYIVSRKSDLIKSGSHRIGPKEIEDVLAEHAAVHEAAVFGVPDEILDERICACVVLRPECACSEKELKLHCKKYLPQYKIPHEVVFVADLPKTTSGKIRKNELRATLLHR